MKSAAILFTLALLVILGLAGCRTFSGAETAAPDLPVPGVYAAAGTGLRGPGGAVREDDPVLRELLREALEQNRDLRQAASRVQAAEAEARIAGADRWPSLGIGGTASRRRLNQIGGGFQVGSVTVSNYDSLLSSNWELDLWGRLADVGRAAALDADAAHRDYEAARLSLSGQVARLWYAMAEAAEQLALAERRLATFESNETLVQRRFERGLADALDLRLIRSQTRSAGSAVEEARASLDAGIRRLEILLGRYPGRELAVRSGLPELGPRPEPGLPSELLRQRPDLRSAEDRLLAAGYRHAAADKLRFPQFSLTAAGGTSSSELRELSNPDFRVWTLVGNLSQPVFQGGRITGSRARAEAQWESAAAAYERAVLEAFREVETALAAESFLHERRAQLEAVVAESVAAEDLAWDRYERGLVEVVTVLEAQRRAFEAQAGLLSIRNALIQNRIDLLLALGLFPVEGVLPPEALEEVARPAGWDEA